MKRQHPLFSSLSIVSTIVLLTGLGLALWRSGGLAFSPGRLSAKHLSGIALQGFASHADFEAQCALCHQPLERPQVELCLACHDSVAEQISGAAGAHSLIDEVQNCAACHPDHRGRDFNPTLPALARFDHAETDFSLVWHQVNWEGQAMDCRACHALQEEFSLDLERCEQCHANRAPEFMAQHRQSYGADCQDCHDGQDTLARFDHGTTQFPLDGSHAGVTCRACHSLSESGAPLERFTTVGRECAACHVEPPVHEGLFSGDCAACHTTGDWKPASWNATVFDHATQSGFSLARHAVASDGSPITCVDCHLQPLAAPPTVAFDLQACVACHSQDAAEPDFMLKHQAFYGESCLTCHDGVDRLSDFDHQSIFPLAGAHAPLECAACHANQVFRGTPATCAGCHAEPPVHSGFFGTQCQLCHQVDAWHPARLQFHSFPLDHGGQGEQACTTCHAGAYVEYTCYGCHEHQPAAIRAGHETAGISADELPACTICHHDGRVQ